MAEREKYYIGLNGQTFEVSKELYETYYKGQRKEKYFTHDLKQEHTKVDKETGEMIVIPSREDSYERLLDANFASSVCVFRLHRCEHIASSVYGYGSSV